MSANCNCRGSILRKENGVCVHHNFEPLEQIQSSAWTSLITYCEGQNLEVIGSVIVCVLWSKIFLWCSCANRDVHMLINSEVNPVLWCATYVCTLFVTPPYTHHHHHRHPWMHRDKARGGSVWWLQCLSGIRHPLEVCRLCPGQPLFPLLPWWPTQP